MFKRIIPVVLFISVALSTRAQLDTITAHIARISAFYDSAQALAFDLRFIYDSDTVLSNYEHRESEGTFIMNRSRFYYRMESIECMQTDSFLITVMEPEQLIMVAPPTTIQSGGIIPIRQKLDSLLNTEDLGGYTYSISTTDSVNKIELTISDPETDFKRITLYYDPETYAIYRYEIGFEHYPEEIPEGEEPDGELLPVPDKPRQMVLRVHFLNYRIANIGEDLFDPDRYIMAGGNGEWKGVGKYEGYTVNKMYN